MQYRIDFMSVFFYLHTRTDGTQKQNTVGKETKNLRVERHSECQKLDKMQKRQLAKLFILLFFHLRRNLYVTPFLSFVNK